MHTNMRKWLDALKSGTYTKTEGYLRTVEDPGVTSFGYCALGVAMVEAEKDGVQILDSDWLDGLPPVPVFDWLGEIDATLAYQIADRNDTMRRCPECMDEEGRNVVPDCSTCGGDLDVPTTFPEIADFIEKTIGGGK